MKRNADRGGWSVAGAVALLAILVAVGIVGYPLYLKVAADARTRVLLSDTKSWADRVEYFRGANGALPPVDQLAGMLTSRPGILEGPDMVTLWPDCQFVGEGPETAPAVGDFILVGSVQPSSSKLAPNVTPIVYESTGRAYLQGRPVPSDTSGCSTAAGGEGAVVAVRGPEGTVAVSVR